MALHGFAPKNKPELLKKIADAGFQFINLPSKLVTLKNDTVIVSWEDGTTFPLPKSSQFSVHLVNPTWLDHSQEDPSKYGFCFHALSFMLYDDETSHTEWHTSTLNLI